MAFGLLLSPGDRLGDYVVESFVAHGSVSEVHRASSAAHPGIPIALKVFSREGLTENGELRFLREATALAGVRHAHLAEVFDHGSSADGRLLFYAMRFVEGETLSRVLDECSRIGPPTPDHLRFLVGRIREVGAALDQLHRRGLVHRDVKPGNIVLRRPAEGSGDDPSAVLVDYGLVRPVRTDAREPSTLQASLSYAAPEHLRGEEVDARVDVFGLGTTLYDVVRGKGPDHPRRIPSFGLEPIERIVPAVDRDLAAIVGCATEVDADWRYADAGALCDDLDRWLAGAPVLARKSAAQRVRRWVARHPDRLLRGLKRAAITLCVVVAIGSCALHSRRIVQARDQGRDAWQAGDLASAREAVVAVPAWLDRCCWPDDLAALAPALREERRGVALAEVVGIERDEGVVAAVLAAATALASSTPAEGDALTRYLAFELDHAQARANAAALGPMLRIVARQCNERPDDSAERVRRSAPLRRSLESLLKTAPADAGALDAISALTGCGIPATGAPILEWLRGRIEDNDERSFEACRLSVRCLQSIVDRSRRAGFDAETLEPRFLASVAAMQALAGSAHAGRVAGDDAVLEGTEQLLCAIEFGRRARGDPVRAWSGFASDRPLVRSACGDPAWKRSFLADVAIAARQGAGGNYIRCNSLGILAGASGDPGLIEAVGAQLLESARAAALDPGWTDSVYRGGVDFSKSRAAGAPITDIDPETTLRYVSEHPWPRELRPQVRTVTRDPMQDEVEWNFLVLPFEVRGEAGSLRLVDASIGTDEFDRHASPYVLLGMPGRSECSFEFRFGGDGLLAPVLEIDAQKGARSGFPHFGEARLECIVDGVEIVEALAPTQGVVQWRHPLPDLRGAEPGVHSLRLRLGSNSNTTLRLFRVRIARPPQSR